MPIKYEIADDLQVKAEEICRLVFPHVHIDSIQCMRSFGSSSRNTIARCHALGKVMQLSLKRKAFYSIEFLSERFDKMSEAEQIKVIIHELMHIPKCFGGGFKHHDFVSDRNVEIVFNHYAKLKGGIDGSKSWW